MTDQRRFRRRTTKNLSNYFLQRAIICKFESDRRRYEKQNDFIQHSINKLQQQIENLNEKLVHFHHLNTLIELPLEDYFEQRMNRLRISAEKHMAEFDDELRNEIEHWRNIHSVLSQPWIEPGLLRSDFGALPRTIQQSPGRGIEPIEEENENNRMTRSLAMINRFSILSNGDFRRKRLNKTFVKIPSHLITDENSIEFTRKSDSNDSSIICLD